MFQNKNGKLVAFTLSKVCRNFGGQKAKTPGAQLRHDHSQRESISTEIARR
jgi:hypothetical protein